MNIAGWALRHRSLVLLVLVVGLFAGLFAARTLPSAVYPEVDFPRIGVVVRQGDMPPDLMQTTILRPMEQTLMTVLGVQRVRSRTIRGGADISLLFSPRTDMWRALQLVESSLGDVKASLPPGTVIRVERVTPVSFPILSFNVSGHPDSRVLSELAQYTIRPALARVRGVGRVNVLGGDTREMEVVIDPDRAGAAHLRPEDVAARIRTALPLVAAGRYDQDRSLVTVLVNDEALGVEDIRSIPVGADASGTPLALGSIATVFEGAEDRLFRTGGPHGEVVIMTVARLEGESTPDVTRDAIAAVEALRPSLPPGIVIEAVYDQGHLVEEAITSVRDAIIIGVVLCIGVLGAFLRDARAGFVAAVAVPTTLVLTFGAMQALGQTLNLMSLGGMAVAIGLVVDDAIVIVEAISRKREAGLDPRAAAEEGTRELAAAVIGTTVTTVIVFLPLAFLQGVVGKFFSALAMTLSASVVISLVVAVVIIPLAAERFMTRPPRLAHGRWEHAYGRLARWSAGRAWLGAVCVVASVAFAVFAVGRIPSGFMPTSDEGAFVLDYETPAGTALDETDRAAKRIEAILRETPEIDTFSRRTGAQINPTAVALLNRGDFAVRLRSGKRRHADDVIASVRARVEREVPAVRVEFVEILQDMLNDLSGTPRPIEVKIFGEDYVVLEKLSREVTKRIADIPGLVDLYGGVERPSPQLVLRIDRNAVARFGRTAEDVSIDVGDALRGTNAGLMRRFDRTIGIRVRYPDEIRFTPSAVARLPLSFGVAGTTEIGAVATLQRDTIPTVLVHEGLQPVVIVTADHEGRDLGSVVRDIEKAIATMDLPRGVRIEMGGQYEAQKESLQNLATVAAAGVLLVLVVLVAQFGSVRAALAVLLTTPLALVGAFALLWITGTPLNTSSLMGCVLLVGLVVKNGILLLEVAEEHAATGTPYEEALALAGERRIRPIAMTTLATLAGLAPLALGIGAGAELQRPLALAVIGGLGLSSLLSTLALPSIAGA
ncbi:MAG TPA: efflux RND transporter permease subunit, partial [Labilithrix sp.]|nr:efflux RND transporter permease subunit [Labilithrix sp.]